MLDKRSYYRMPYSLNDNPIAWIEVTDKCNLHCDGCFRQNITGHKPLENLKKEVDFFMQWRNPDNFSIAGGEPLIHPQIIELISYIARKGVKPEIITNGMALTPEYIHKLKAAGLAGLTVHIDSHQGRPDWKQKNEKENNELRQIIADMVAAEGGICLLFNTTVYPNTYQEIPDIVRWGHENIEKVQGLVFITYRTATIDDNVALDINAQQVDLKKLSYTRDSFNSHLVTSPEVYQIIKENFPEYEASGYLGGSIRHDSFKWIASVMIGSKHKIYGSIGKKTMELAQTAHHLFKGRYLAYATSGRIGLKVFLLSPLDKIVREAGKNWLRDTLRHPGHMFNKIFMQSIVIVQAPDILPDGRADMCDGCPDITIYNGKFVNSCRLDEYRLFGGFVSVVKKENTFSDSKY